MIFSYPLAFDASFSGSLLEYCHPIWYGKIRMMGLRDGGNTFKDMYNHLDKILACDRRTDILPRHSPAMHMRRAVKNGVAPGMTSHIQSTDI